MRSLEQIKLSVSDFPSFITFSLRGYLQARCDNFRAGCVSHSSDAWSRLTSDKEIIKLIEKDCYMASIDLKDAYYDKTFGQKISPLYVAGYPFPVHLFA